MLGSTTPATIENIEDRAGNVSILTLVPSAPVTWQAGQYMHIGVEGYGHRSYSIASNPGDHGRIVFHIRNMGSGLSAYLSNLKSGDIIGIKGPHGDMNADAAKDRPVLMIAGGTGIAPMLALINDIVARNITDAPITLIYGMRSTADIYCQPELDALNATQRVTTHIVTDPQMPDLHLRQLGMDLSNHVIYVSGPDPMMLPVHMTLADLGASRDNIFCDADMEALQKAPQ